MASARIVKRQLEAIIRYLVETGLASDQAFPVYRELGGGRAEVTFKGAELTAVSLKDVEYREIYATLAHERAFSVRMLDGALIQLMYLYHDDRLIRHRLAFFSSPDLIEFQSNPEIYLEDQLYADVIGKSIVGFPFRFDFDCREDVRVPLHHPTSHLTLGQYENCRIPVTHAVTPSAFFDFVLRNFYHTAFLRYADDMPSGPERFDECICAEERAVTYLQIPASQL